MALRSRAEAWLERIWYRPQPPPLALQALARLYAAGLNRDRARGLRRAERLPVPVVVVGNPRVGGSGKTPLVLWLLDWLQGRGVRAGVLSRGYGARLAGPRLVTADDDAQAVGDEPLLIARASGAPVCVGPRRLDAGRLLLARQALDLLVCDDGLQHWPLQRDMEIVVDGSADHLDNGWLLPAGPWRMPADWVSARALRIAPSPAPVGAHAMAYRNRWLHPVVGTRPRRALTDLAGVEVDALAGIARPERFFDTLRRAGLRLRDCHAPGDHGRAAAELLARGERPLLMTAKDAVKYPSAARECWWLEHACEPDAGFVAALAARLATLLPGQG